MFFYFPEAVQHKMVSLCKLSIYIAFIILYFTGRTLEDQGVTHNAKVMVLQLEQSDEETKRKVQEEELQRKKEKDISDKMQRTKKGLEILAERGEAELVWRWRAGC